MTVTRRTPPRPELDPRDVEIAHLKAVIAAAQRHCRDAFAKANGNRAVADLALDLRNILGKA